MKLFYKRLLSIGIAIGVFCALAAFTLGQREFTRVQVREEALKSDTYKIINSDNYKAVYYMGLDYASNIQSLIPKECLTDVKAYCNRATTTYESEPLPVETIVGTGCNFQILMNMDLLQGRYFSTKEVEEGSKVCVVKSSVYDWIRSKNPTQIDINGEAYQIIGVVSGNDNADSFDDGGIYVPVTTLYHTVENASDSSGFIHQILFDIGDYSENQFQKLLKENAQANDIDISQLKVMPYQYNEFSDNYLRIKIFAIIFIISLLVLLIACLNIIHIATASILDREKEIGLKTALGATKKDITNQIMKEILTCALGGGLLGTALASIFNSIMNMIFGEFVLSFNLITILAGTFLAAFAGWITSLIPARKAAGMDPLAALREE